MSSPGPGKHPVPLAAALAAIPPILLASMIANFGVDVPYWDEWQLVPYSQLADSGRLSLGSLLEQHNEHRLLFPRAVMLALARLTAWDVRGELWLSFAVSLASFALFARGLQRTLQTGGRSAAGWALPLASLLFFSLRQWENFTWGWQIQIHMNVLAVVAGLFWVTGRGPGVTTLLGATALGLVAQYSFASGLAYWPVVGLAVVWAGGASTSSARARRTALWSLVSIACIATYFVGYVKPSDTPDAWIFLRRPLGFVQYFLAYLGAPLAPDGDSRPILAWATAAGAFGLLLFGFAAQKLLRSGRASISDLVPYAALALYAVANAAVTAAGRVGLGAIQALVSRYVTFSQLLWLSDLALVCLLLAAPRNAGERTASALGVRLGVAAVVLALLPGFYSGAERFVRAYKLLGAARRALAAHQNADALYVLYPKRDVLLERAAVLDRLRLSVYRRRSGTP